MAGLTLLSRASGFGRIVVVGSVLGVTYLGNTYQSANSIPNALFELFAAGALQAALVPTLTSTLQSPALHTPAVRTSTTSRDTLDSVSGSVLTVVVGGSAVLGVASLVAARPLMEFLVRDVEDAGVAAAQVDLGVTMMWFFAPQLIFYGVNLVATAVLHSTGSFSAPAIAPLVNNVVVIGAYLWFDRLGGGHDPGLDLTASQLWVLAGGTTVAVIAFCSLPVVAAWRRGWRPSFAVDPRSTALRRLARDGTWSALFLGAAQILSLAILATANGSEGAVVVYQLAFVVFMLPQSVLNVPVTTTRFTELSRAVRDGDHTLARSHATAGVSSIVILSALATGLQVGLAGPIAQLIARGRAAADGEAVAAAIRSLSPGLAGFGLLLFSARVCYSRSDSRTPTIVVAVSAAFGIASLMVAGSSDDLAALVGRIGTVHSVVYLAAGTVLIARNCLLARIDPRTALGVAARAAVAGVATGTAAWVVGSWIGFADDRHAIATCAVGSVAAVGVGLVVVAVSGPGTVRSLVTTMGASATGWQPTGPAGADGLSALADEACGAGGPSAFPEPGRGDR